MLPNPVTWAVLFSSVPACGDLTVVVRVDTAFGVQKRVQGFVSLQQCGSLFHLVLDGHEVAGDSTQGELFRGSFHFPDSVPWTLTCKKAKSVNESSIRGRCSVLEFDANPTGVTFMQIAVLRDNPNNTVAKKAALAFEHALQQANDSVRR